MDARPISDALRRALAEAPVSRYALAKVSGVDPPSLCRFLHDGTSLSLARADMLAAALGLELVPKKQPKRPGRRAKR